MISNLRRWARFTLGRGAPRDHRERRSRGIFQGTASGAVWRVVMILVSVISIPLTIRYLGSERYGVWMTISTVLVLLNITDFGLANSLTNALGKSQAQDAREAGQRYITSAFAVLSLIAAVILICGTVFASSIAAFLFPHLQSPLARTESGPAVMIALWIFALNLPLVINTRVLAAHHENSLANLWNIVGAIGNLGAILIVIWFKGGLTSLICGCFGFGLLTNIACAAWLFGFHKPWLRPKLAAVDLAFIKNLFSDGWKFFVTSVGSTVTWQTDNIVIAHFIGAALVTPYNVCFHLFTIATGLQTLVQPSLWPAYTDAYARRDYDWIRQTLRSNFKFSFFTTIVIVGILTIFANPIIRVWAGAVAVPPFSVIIWMAAWRLMLSTLSPGICLLNATGHLKGLAVYVTITAVLNLLLSILLAKICGISGVIAATAIAYAVASCIPIFVEVRGVLRNFPAVSTKPQAVPRIDV
ncbi:MAG: oligosaccharide flippase family protein [Verrucomicrobiota bacterium]